MRLVPSSLYSLRDCTCAMDYKRIYILLYLFTSLFMFRLEKTNRLLIIYYFAGIINIYFVIKYLTSLTCDCSNSPLKNILYLYIIKDGLLITLEGLSIILKVPNTTFKYLICMFSTINIEEFITIKY